MKIALILMMALMAVGLFALDIGGSTAVTGMRGDDYQKMCVDQEIDVDIGVLHFDVDGGYDYDLIFKEGIWDYELGTSFSLASFVFGTLINGEKDLELNENKSYVDFAYENFGFNVTVLLSFDELKDRFQGAEFSVFCNPEPVELRLGYLLTDEGAEVAGDAPDEPQDGGFYAKAKVSY